MPPWLNVAADEVLWLPRRMGGVLGVVLYLGFLAILGYLFPVALGMDFVNAQILLVYACSGPLFLSSVAVESFSDLPEGSREGVLAGKLIAAAGFGWMSAGAALALALVTVNRAVWHGAALVPDAAFLAGIFMLGLSLAVFTAAMAVVLCLWMGEERRAKRALRNGYFLVLLGVVLLVRYGEAEWQASFDSLLGPERIARLAVGGTLVLGALSAALIRMAARHAQFR